MSQSEMGQVGGVSRNSQTAYETGKTPFTSDYLRLVAQEGVDPLFVISGQRSARTLTDEQAALFALAKAMSPSDREVLLRVASSLAGHSSPATLKLPSTAALEEAFQAFFDVSAGLTGDVLVHELATSLPSILAGAQDEIAVPASDRADTPPAPQEAPGGDRRARGPGPRT